MKTSVICLSIILCLGTFALTTEDQDRQLSNLGTNPLGTLLGFGGSGLSAGALATLAGSNPALAALFGSGLNGLTGTGPVVSGFAGAGASGLLSGSGNGLSDLLSGGKGGKGGKTGKGGKDGKGKGKGKGRMLERQLSNLGTNPLGTLLGLGGAGASSLVSGGGNGVLDSLLSGAKGGKAGTGGKAGKGGKDGKGGKGKGKGKGGLSEFFSGGKAGKGGKGKGKGGLSEFFSG